MATPTREATDRELSKVYDMLGAAQSELSALRDELYVAKEARDAEMLEALRLQNKLNAAEQRNAELMRLLQSAKCVAEAARTIEKEAFGKGTKNVDPGRFRGLGILLAQYDALKPTESGASE